MDTTKKVPLGDKDKEHLRKKTKNSVFNILTKYSSSDIVKGAYTKVGSVVSPMMKRELREKYKIVIGDIIDNKFKDDKYLNLLKTKIYFDDNKQTIKTILVNKISYIFSEGQSRLNYFNSDKLKKNFEKDEEDNEEGDEEGNEEGNEEGDEEGDKKTNKKGGGRYGARDFDKVDAKDFIEFILETLNTLDNETIDINTRKLLFSNYLKILFTKVTPKELNKLLPDIKSIKTLSISAIQHFIIRLNEQKASVLDEKTTSPNPAAKIAELNFTLKSNVKAFTGAIVDITLNSELVVGTKEKIDGYLDNKYNIAMNIPSEDEKARIDNHELNNAIKAILGPSINTIKDYRERIISIDNYIDSINEDNIDSKLQNLGSVLTIAKLENGKIIYKLPEKIATKLNTRIEEKTEAAAIEVSSQEKLAQATQLIQELLETYSSQDIVSPVSPTSAQQTAQPSTQPSTQQSAQQSAQQTAQQIQRTKMEKFLASLGTPSF
jgi:hypothetical protein